MKQLFFTCVICALALTLATTGCTNAVDATESEQSQIPQTVDSIMALAIANDTIPGAVVGVISNGVVVYKKGYGLKRLDMKAAPDEFTVLSLGSISKAITAVGMFTLIEQGKITLQDPLSKWINDLPVPWQQTPLVQYMSHTSGIPEMGNKKDTSFIGQLKIAGTMKMSFCPDSCQQYNNFNFALMGEVIDSASRTPYLTYMNSFVFQPAGMRTTGVDISSGNIAWGYTYHPKKIEPIKRTHFRPGQYGVASGGLQSNMHDMCNLITSLLNDSLLSKASIQTMWSRYQHFNYTPGWQTTGNGKSYIVEKYGDGSDLGCTSIVKIDTTRKIAVIIMTNKFSPTSAGKVSDIAANILQSCFKIANVKPPVVNCERNAGCKN
jgi:CubicO group peptidase (beta-lactamase class C family)